MAGNSQNITISSCSEPGSSPVGYVEGLSIQLGSPYSETEVTIKFNACDDEEQAATVKETKATRILKFDFGRANSKKVRVKSSYKVKLVSVNKGPDCYSYDLLVEW
jgi:hypothetical protein